MSGSDEREMHAAIVCHEQRRTHVHGSPGLAEPRARGYEPHVPPAIENSGKSVQKDVKTGKSAKPKARIWARKEKRQKARASQRDHHVASSVSRPATWARTVHLAGKARHVSYSSRSPGFTGFAGMLIEISMISGLPSFANFTHVRPFLWLWNLGQWCDDEHVWISGARGNPRLTRDLRHRSRNTNQLHFVHTFVNGDSQTSNSRVTFSVLVTSKVSVSLHFSCFGQAAEVQLGLDVVRALDVIPDAVRGKVYSRRFKVYLPTTTLPSGFSQVIKRAACLTGGDHCRTGRTEQ